MKDQGQNLVEFGIILGVIAVVCIVALTFFGENVKNLFVGSNQEYNKQTAFKWKEASASNVNQPKQYVSNVPTGYNPIVKVDSPAPSTSYSSSGISTVTTSPAIGTTTIAGVTVTKHQDNTLSFIVGNQEVFISPKMQELSDIAFETSGGVATSNLIKEIKYMIEKHATEYPAGVPIQVYFGDSDRANDVQNVSGYEGKALVNAFNIQVGQDMVILQKDQSCTVSGACFFKGDYRLEGSYDSNNKFTGKVESKDLEVYGTFEGSIDTSNGISLNDPLFELYQTNPKYTWYPPDDKNAKNYVYEYNWTINFDNSQNFNITNL